MRFRMLLAGFALSCPAALANFPSGNPINAVIPLSDFTVEIEDVVTIPRSGNNQQPRMEDLVFGGDPSTAYVIDQRGPVWAFDPTDANPSPQLFFDLYDTVADERPGNQTGLRGMAFHPNFNTPGTDGYRKFYTSHSRQPFSSPVGSPAQTVFWSPPDIDHDSVVGEWMVDAQGNVDTGSYRELMRVGQPEFDHNIGQIGFNPTAKPGDADYGNLYIALGDGGGPGDPNDLAQNRTTITNVNSGGLGFPHGSMLRINPIATASDPYQIPADNPFVGEANAIEEVWAYGLRNPHKFAWDTVTGKLLISDIGQNNIEEINLGQAGANYGWPLREGTFEFVNNSTVRELPASHPTDDFTYPVAQYDHDPDNDNNAPGGFAVVGGPVYRGDAIPGLQGKYLFGDFASGLAIYAVGVGDLVQEENFTDLSSLEDGLLAPYEEIRFTENGVERPLSQIIGNASSRTDMRLEVGPDGEVYVLNKRDGIVRRLVSTAGITPGDYNGDGVVNAADYTVWRDNLGAPSGTLDNDPEGGPAGPAQFEIWRSNFTPPTAGPFARVPEPTALLLLGIATLARRQRQWRRKMI
ncbi:MAG: PQQ-dependent sugar dehydrogenase [Planctomycetota bacterium]